MYIIGLLLLFGLFAYTSVGSKSKQSIQKPNIVLIMGDDMGYSDLGCYGSEIQTPNLDRLASEGLRMTQFYNTAKCTETRATILTGLYHQQTDNLNRSDNNVTIAEVLRESGYRTILSGKWHLGNWLEEKDTPNDRGFDAYFGFLGGAINFFTGKDWQTDENYMRLNREVYEVPDNFYSTDAFTAYAKAQIKEATARQQPFFLYLAHNAPHFPLQVPEENIAKYRDTYAKGWDSLRVQRLKRMKELGVVDENLQVTPRDILTPAWESLSVQEQKEEQLLMATYAGMIDRLDEQIGRLLAQIDELGITENTIIIFLSDNEGCPFDANRTPALPPGPAEALRTYDTEWAQVSNTPFRMYKQWIHEGGIATPMIVRWPKYIKANTITDVPGQIVDLMPTIVDIAQAEYPFNYQGHKVLPMEGISLLPVFEGKLLSRKEPMFWEYNGSRAVREGNWKLVAERGREWELYNLKEDRTEMDNLVEKYPEKRAEMAKKYDAWAKRIGAISNTKARSMPINKQDRYLYAGEKK